MIVLTGLFVIGMIWLLFSRWLALSEPQFLLLVIADDPWADAIVTVDGATLSKPLITGVVANHTVRKYPFYLDRGSYRLTVERGGVTALQQEFLISGGRSAEFDLRKYDDALARCPRHNPQPSQRPPRPLRHPNRPHHRYA